MFSRCPSVCVCVRTFRVNWRQVMTKFTYKLATYLSTGNVAGLQNAFSVFLGGGVSIGLVELKLRLGLRLVLGHMCSRLIGKVSV